MLIPFGMTIEIVGNKYKTLFGLLYKVPFSLGEVIIGLLAIGVGDYATFQWVLSIPIFILAFLSIWIVPESPRWLIKKKRYSKATNIVNNAAKFNKVCCSLLFPHRLHLIENRILHIDNKKRIQIFSDRIVPSFAQWSRRRLEKGKWTEQKQ